MVQFAYELTALKPFFTPNGSLKSHGKIFIYCLILVVLLCWNNDTWIKQWPINWCTFPMTIHKITLSVDYNLWLKRLYTQPMNNQSEFNKSSKIRKRYYKTLVTSVINNPMSPPALGIIITISARVHASQNIPRIWGIILMINIGPPMNPHPKIISNSDTLLG